MPQGKEQLKYFGPDPTFDDDPRANIHHQMHHRVIGKEISAIFLGDDERFASLDHDNSPPDGVFRSEYLAFEFTDGTSLALQIGSGNSFHVAGDDEAARVLDRAYTAAKKRASSPPSYSLFTAEAAAPVCLIMQQIIL